MLFTKVFEGQAGREVKVVSILHVPPTRESGTAGHVATAAGMGVRKGVLAPSLWVKFSLFRRERGWVLRPPREEPIGASCLCTLPARGGVGRGASGS